MPATLHNALLVLVVQSLSTLFPFTPGGVGTQQGLLVYVFDRAGTGIAGALLLSFSVGMYIAVTIENVVDRFHRALPHARHRPLAAGRARRGRGICSRSVSLQPHPVRIVVTDDLAPLAADRLLPALPRDPALHLGVPDRHAPSPSVVFVNWFILLVKATHAGRPARVHRRVHPLPDAPGGVLPPRREPLPALLPARQRPLPGRPRDRPARRCRTAGRRSSGSSSRSRR